MNIRKIEEKLESYAERETALLASDASIPLYYQMYRLLKRFIETAPLQTGDRFPSVELVSSLFGVSRPTANRAVQELIDQGWLARERGRGTFVQEGSFLGLALLSEHLSLSDQFPPDAVLDTTFIRQHVTTTEPHCARALRLPPDEPLLFIRRLRRVNGQPVMVCDSYLPAARFPDLKKSTFVRSSLYATLEEVYGFVITRSERKVAAQELVDRQVAELLGVPPFSPILYFTGLTFVEDEDDPIEYMDARVRECVAFTNTVRRNRSKRSGQSENLLGVRRTTPNA